MASISERELKAAHRHSMENRQLLTSGGECGCFHCLNTFAANEVTDWTNDGLTALCPRCGIDAVLSSNIDSIDRIFLQRMHDFWFGQTVRLNLSDEVNLQKPDAAA
jgi:NAD-dependent SIR2 family protein deacetylase